MMPATLSPTSPVASALPTELLVVGDAAATASYGAMLRSSYRVSTTSAVEVAKQYLHRNPPALVVTELTLPVGSSVDICREAKSLSTAPPVLVTTSDAELVPDALAAGCDAVLLKPFAPNLLFARIGRLLRERATALRLRADQSRAKTSHLTERAEQLLAGTNHVWPNTHCPYCTHAGVTSFEYASHRRSWYACLQCRKVWIAKRQE